MTRQATIIVLCTILLLWPMYSTGLELSVQLTRTPILSGKTDIFLSVKNNTNHDLFVPNIRTGATLVLLGSRLVNADGKFLRFPNDFSLLKPNQMILLPMWIDCELKKGLNRIRIEVEYRLEADTKIPDDGAVLDFDIPELIVEYE